MNDPISRCAYHKINETIEKWTKIIHFILIQVVTICGIILVISLPYYLYFTTDIGNDALRIYIHKFITNC